MAYRGAKGVDHLVSIQPIPSDNPRDLFARHSANCRGPEPPQETVREPPVLILRKEEMPIVISYCWLDKAQADPDGKHVRTICAAAGG